MSQETAVADIAPDTTRTPSPESAVSSKESAIAASPGRSRPPSHAHSPTRAGGRSFAKGNRLALDKTAKNKAALQIAQTRRYAIVRAMMDATTLSRARRAVRKMFDIIEGDDAKASVMAFKALFDTVGIRSAVPDESGAKPQAFVFMLPAAGTIPEPVVIEAKPVANLAAPEFPEATTAVLEAPEAIEATAAVRES